MSTLVPRRTFACLIVAAAIAPAANAADTAVSSNTPDLRGVRAAIKAKNYDSALAQLKVIVATSSHPDVYSLMGFALRKTGDRAQAMTYYRKALEADPTHKGALEYQGELYVEIGQIDKAKENLAKLHKICWPFGCEEHDDLKEDIEHASLRK
ncbi:tetratricopeptide repeat protein [Acidisphaera sp. S103]|uniref:tetratricopeptide repeat protein n=1 Tax=Acidisphaera sp. S103 TaxID=1747223 RepID=UPI00131AA1F1|nr:tetratricopeptide repeat protein [Acidisphaera sp. S103]